MKQLLIIALALALLCGIGSAASLVIDPFSKVDTDVEAKSGTPTDTATDTDASILGGKRKTTVDYTTGANSVTAKLSDFVPPYGGDFNAMSLSSDSGTTGDWTLEWGTGSAGGTALGDLTLAGALDSVVVKVLDNDLAVDMDLTLTDGSAGTATVTKSTTGAPGFLAYMFTDFGGVDPSDIASMKLVGAGVTNADLTIDFISAEDSSQIPEPATMALMGMAVCGLGGYIRKRRRA